MTKSWRARILLEMLRRHADIAVAAECANGFEAVKAIAEIKPDLVSSSISKCPNWTASRCWN